MFAIIIHAVKRNTLLVCMYIHTYIHICTVFIFIDGKYENIGVEGVKMELFLLEQTLGIDSTGNC